MEDDRRRRRRGARHVHPRPGRAGLGADHHVGGDRRLLRHRARPSHPSGAGPPRRPTKPGHRDRRVQHAGRRVGPVQPVPAPGAYPAHQHRHRPAGHRRRRCVRQGADRQPGHQAASQHAGEGPPTATRRFRREAEQLLVPLRHRGAQRTRRLSDDHRAGVPVPQPDRADGQGSAQRRAPSPRARPCAPRRSTRRERSAAT